MIIDDTEVGRYVFILDINDGKPFRGSTYQPSSELDDWEPFKLHHMTDPVVIAQFSPMRDWLDEQTSAYRINTVTMTHRQYNQIVAVMIQVPETLAVLFRLYWYDG